MYEDLLDFGDFIKSLVEKKETPEEFINGLTSAYENKIAEVTRLIADFEEKKKSDLWWDSKVPEKDKMEWRWRFRTFTIPYKNISYSTKSNKHMVINAVTILYNFYKDIEVLTQEIDKVMLEQGINVAEPKINSLIFRLKDDIAKAKKDKEETQSSTVYNLNKELVAVQSQVVSKLQIVIWEASQKRNLTAAKQLAQGTDLNQECRGIHEEYENRNRELEGENQALKEEKQVLVEEKQVLVEENQELKQEFEDFKREVATVMQNVTIEGVKECKRKQ